jgi:hypothetical protein
VGLPDFGRARLRPRLMKTFILRRLLVVRGTAAYLGLVSTANLRTWLD